MKIVWMLRNPAPAEILELVACTCKKAKCATQACVCRNHGLKCTDLCGCKDCENGGACEERDEDISGDDDLADDESDVSIDVF